MSGKIGVALSGGVDSLCALILLKRAGREVVGLRGAFLEDESETIAERLSAICEKLRVPLHFIDLKKQFAREVSKPFREAWMSGLTPNPCVACNKKIKFGALLDAAREIGCETMATGHYALRKKNCRGATHILARAPRTRKDQSYFLALLDEAQIAAASFPLGLMDKPPARAIVRLAGFEIPEEEESRDICFMQSRRRADALEDVANPGPIILRDAKSGVETRAGTHRGLWHYTPGQRKGLNIPYKEPLYAIEKDMERNILYVGTRKDLGQESARVVDPVYHACPDYWPEKVYVKIRSVGEPIPCDVFHRSGRIDTRFLNGKAAVAAGQIAAFYDDAGVLLAGGTLSEERNVL